MDFLNYYLVTFNVYYFYFSIRINVSSLGNYIYFFIIHLCYARRSQRCDSLTFFAYNTNGSKGIAAGLGNVQKLRDGEPLGGRSRAEDDFDIEEDDDFLA